MKTKNKRGGVRQTLAPLLNPTDFVNVGFILAEMYQECEAPNVHPCRTIKEATQALRRFINCAMYQLPLYDWHKKINSEGFGAWDVTLFIKWSALIGVKVKLNYDESKGYLLWLDKAHKTSDVKYRATIASDDLLGFVARESWLHEELSKEYEFLFDSMFSHLKWEKATYLKNEIGDQDLLPIPFKLYLASRPDHNIEREIYPTWLRNMRLPKGLGAYEEAKLINQRQKQLGFDRFSYRREFA